MTKSRSCCLTGSLSTVTLLSLSKDGRKTRPRYSQVWLRPQTRAKPHLPQSVTRRHPQYFLLLLSLGLSRFLLVTALAPMKCQHHRYAAPHPVLGPWWPQSLVTLPSACPKSPCCAASQCTIQRKTCQVNRA